ncbi:MAG: hypothetical protein PHT62_09670 [Desulfotomaculaceae bacterium]|nr:hypothetical protein [Desulfotomaculaceae bacterium]
MRRILVIMIIACAVLLGACSDKASQDVMYSNDKYGFSMNLPGDFAAKVDVRESGNCIYFVDKEVQAVHPEHPFGVVGRIEAYDKREFSMENLQELEGMYGFRFLGESGSYYFGWAHATDVQLPAEASEKTIEDYRALEKEFNTIIESFRLSEASDGEQITGPVEQTDMQNGIDEYSLIMDEQAISLKSWDYDVDLSAILGEPVSETIEVLGSTADTYSGSHRKTLKYEGLTVQLSSPKDNGKEFWIVSMFLTNERLQTPGGITVGSTLADLKGAYKDLEIVPDGRTDIDNCAYSLDRERYEYMVFEVEEGVVKEIKLYVELP